MQAGAKGRYRPFPEKRAPIARLQMQARLQARPARREIRDADVRLRQAAAREAEASPDIRRARASVSTLFHEGGAGQGLDGRESAAASRIAAGQRCLSHGL